MSILFNHLRNRRIEILNEIEKKRNSTVLSYIHLLDGAVSIDDFKFFTDVFCDLEEVDIDSRELDIIIETHGGSGEAAAKLVHQCREYFKQINIIVLKHALSAGTLIAIGCNKICMTPLSELSPIDPQIYLSNEKRWTSANTLDEYINIMKEFYEDLSGDLSIKNIFPQLSPVNLFDLGFIKRSQQNAKHYAKKFLTNYSMEGRAQEDIDATHNLLLIEYATHQHRIFRKEAINTLKLNVEKVDPDSDPNGLFNLLMELRRIYYQIETELQMIYPFGQYVLIETKNKGFLEEMPY